MANKSMDMCSGPIFKKVVIYTIPLILTSILQLLFNAADLIVVGRFCGSVSLAAVGATSSLTNLLVNSFMGLSTGAGVAAAHAIGAGDDKSVHRVVHTTIPVAIISGGIVSVVGIVLSRTLLGMMDTPDNIIGLSTLYMRIYFAGMIFNMLYNFGASILRAAGDTKSPLIFLLFAGVVNICLNVVFVTVFHMNVAGVALATTISQAVSAVLVTGALMRRTDACKLIISKLKIYKYSLKKILIIGIPTGIQSSLFSLANIVIQSSVNSFGDIAISGSSAASNIEGFLYVIVHSFSITVLNFVGQNYGAKLFARIKRIFIICIISVSVSGVVTGLLFYVFGEQLLSIYINDSPLAIQYGLERIIVFSLTYFICGMMDCTSGALRGMDSSLPAMFITITGVCGIRIGWIMTFFKTEMFHSLTGLFLSFPISWTITFIAQAIAFVIVYKKRKKKIIV